MAEPAMTPERYKQVRDLAGAALDRPEAERRAFLAAACGADEALRAEVSSLLAAADEVRDSPFLENAVALTDGIATGTTSETVEALPPGCRVGPYEILEAIGHGGMGSVYRAVRADETYRQVVAVKVVRRGMETPAAQRRFREERQILAALEHPGIARLLDGGTTEDGLPYLVMEHVPGDPIDAYCDGGRLGVPERLRLFVKVCEAVHHAHRSLVVHRDLKPGNILVTPEGTPKLLDFGIARLLSPPDAATPADHTATSLRAFTPQYASPEQVRGTPVTTSSDVYSLGVVLYELLAGSRPHEGGLAHEMMAAICNVDPDRPSTCVARTKIRTTGSATAEITPEAVSETRGLSPALLRRKLSGDLDTIVLKALRKAPTDRYASVEALADDVRRHLEGRPVQARPQTAGYRAGKFVRRNPGLVAASVLALAALLGGSVVSTRQARIARGERARAEKRFTDVRKLANSLIFELHDSIEDLPGATAARKLIVERALEYLDSLAEEAGEDLSLQRELADAYKRIGDLQGGPYTANLGDTPSALRSYERARSIRQALLASHPGEVSDLVGLAEASRLTADALRASSNPSGALDHVRRAVHMLEAARPSHPQDKRLLEELMRAYGAEASLQGSFLVNTGLGDLSAALWPRRNQLEIAERLHEMSPGDPDSLRTLASALSAMGDQLLMTGQRRQASDHFLRARQHLLTLPGLSTSRASLFALHDNYYRMVLVHLANGESELARSTAQRALELIRQLVAADPHNAQARLILAADLASLGDVLSTLGRHEEARAALSEALRTDADLVRRHPNTAQFRHIRQIRFLVGGEICYRSGHYAQAVRYYGEAKDILKPQIAADPKNQGAQLRLAFAQKGMGFAYLRLRQLELAAQAYRESLTLVSPMLDSGSPREDAIYAAADAYAGLGELEEVRAAAVRGHPSARRSHLRQALAWIDRSLEAWQRVKEPGLVSPDGYPCTPVEDVRARRDRISTHLRR